MVDVGKHIWRSSCPTQLLKQGHQAIASCVQVAFEYVQGWSLHQIPEELGYPFRKKVFHDVQSLLCVSVCPLPVTGHHWEHPGSTLFASSLQIFILTDDFPPRLLFPRLNSHSFLSLSSSLRCSRFLIIFLALCWTLSSKSVFCFYWKIRNWTQHTRCGLTRSEEGKNHLPSPAVTPPSAAQHAVCLPWQKATWLLQVLLVSTRHQGCFLQSCFVVFGLFALQEQWFSRRYMTRIYNRNIYHE